VIGISAGDVEVSRVDTGCEEETSSELEGAVDGLESVGEESGDVEGDTSRVMLSGATEGDWK
jgi:hypothetical protein